MLRKRIRELDIPLWARNRALHYLAGSYKLSDELRHKLNQVGTATLAVVTKTRRARVWSGCARDIGS
jgi:hypothetical protein